MALTAESQEVNELNKKSEAQAQDLDVESSLNSALTDGRQAGERSSAKKILKYLKRNQRLLPGLIIICFAIYEICEALLKTSTRLHILRLSCLYVSDDPDFCRHDTNKTMGQEVDSEIQKVAAPYLISYTVLHNGPATISCLFLGAWSDRHGRKPVVLLSLVGQILACIFFSLSDVPGVGYIPGGTVCLLAGVLIYGICGKSTSFIVGASSYVTDCSTTEERTRLLSRLIGVGFFGSCVGYALVSAFALLNTFQWTLLTIVIADVVLFMTILIFIKESIAHNHEFESVVERPQASEATEHAVTTENLKRRNEREKTRPEVEVGENEILVPIDKRESRGICFAVVHIIKFCKRSRQQSDRGYIITLLICCFINNIVKVGEIDAMLLYVTREKVGWDDKLYGAYLGSNYIAMSLQLLLLYPLLEKFLKPSDESCIIFGASIKGVTLAANGLTDRTVLLFVYGILSSFGAFVTCVSRSKLTKLTSEAEVGAVLALTSFMEVLAAVLGSSLFTEIFVETRRFHAGIVFFILSALQASIGIIILCFQWYACRSKARRNL
ncbi:hypothetical protein Aperf_G00000028727 [Anoplocephala perfoliata]